MPLEVLVLIDKGVNKQMLGSLAMPNRLLGT